MKTCRVCKKNKPLNEFYKSPIAKDKHQNECKECTKQRTRASYLKKRENIKCPRCNSPMGEKASMCHSCYIKDVKIEKYCCDCGKPISIHAERCRSCQSKKHARTHGKPIGYRRVVSQGYVLLKTRIGHDSGNYVMEHRYVMEHFLGRKLTSNEAVHHVDGNKANNAIDNLILLSHSQHNKINHFLALLNELTPDDRQKIIQTIIFRYPEMFSSQ